MALIRQLLAGFDFATSNEAARQMANFVYLVGDEGTRRCVLIDPAWDVEGLLRILKEGGWTLQAAVATHGHADHIGGGLHGVNIQGLADLLKQRQVPILVHSSEAGRLTKAGIPEASLQKVDDGDVYALGETKLEFLHTPGHTAGCMCIRAGDALFTGDTMFVDECGRVDLPGSDPDAMWKSLERLASLPDQTVVYPGHDYGPTRTASMASQRKTNPNLGKTLEEWRSTL